MLRLFAAASASTPSVTALPWPPSRSRSSPSSCITATPWNRPPPERVFVDRVLWLATGAPNPQVRAIAAFKLDKLATRLRAAVPPGESEQAQHRQLAADIKRFLERPADTQRVMPAPEAPPGAPIGDPGMDWLAPAPWR
jgi:hypothetical protein